MNKKVIRLISVILIFISLGLFLQNIAYADAVAPDFLDESMETNGVSLLPRARPPIKPKTPDKPNSTAVVIACVSTVVVLLVVFTIVTSKESVNDTPEAATKVDNKEIENKDNIEKGE